MISFRLDVCNLKSKNEKAENIHLFEADLMAIYSSHYKTTPP